MLTRTLYSVVRQNLPRIKIRSVRRFGWHVVRILIIQHDNVWCDSQFGRYCYRIRGHRTTDKKLKEENFVR